MIPSIYDLASKIDYIYAPVPHLYADKELFVYLKDGTWSIQLEGEKATDVGKFCRCETFDIVLEELKAQMYDLSSLQSALFNNVTTIAVAVPARYDEIVELVGLEAVQDAKQRWEEFARGIAEVIEKVEKKSKFEVIG